jgi:hypothetical protein
MCGIGCALAAGSAREIFSELALREIHPQLRGSARDQPL